MKASEWRSGIESSLPQAQDAIMSAVLDPAMRMPVDWVGIPVSNASHQGVLYVGCDALMVGDPGDSVRVDVDAVSHQAICDSLGLQMPTAKMFDLMYENREIAVEPQTFSPDKYGQITITDPATGDKIATSMMSVAAMFAHSARIDAAVAGRGGLVVNSGKAWIISKKLGGTTDGDWTAANYGWYSSAGIDKSATGNHKIWQSVGTRHNIRHVDYSQVCFAVHPMMMIDGQAMPTADVLRSAELASLVSHEGPLQFVRQPGVPPYEPPGGVTPIAPDIAGIRMVGQPGAAPSGRGGLGPFPGGIAVGDAGTAGKIVSVGVGLFAGWLVGKYVLGL